MAMAAQGARSPTAKSADCSPKDGSRGKSDVRFRSQFRKTELCAFFMKGWCSKGGRCEFAHGEHELQSAPDLSKTSLCKKWLRHACERRSEDCPFAHGARELRVTETFAIDNHRRAKEARQRPGTPPDVLECGAGAATPTSSSSPPSLPTQAVVSLELAVACAPPQAPLACEEAWSPCGPAQGFPQAYHQECQIYPMGCNMLDLLATSPTACQMNMGMTYALPMCSTPMNEACCQEVTCFGMQASQPQPQAQTQSLEGDNPCALLIAAIASQASGDLETMLRQAALAPYED